MNFESISCATNGEARKSFAADSDGLPFWAAIHVGNIEHPKWWPRDARPVPGFEHMIVGSQVPALGCIAIVSRQRRGWRR